MLNMVSQMWHHAEAGRNQPDHSCSSSYSYSKLFHLFQDPIKISRLVFSCWMKSGWAAVMGWDAPSLPSSPFLATRDSVIIFFPLSFWIVPWVKQAASKNKCILGYIRKLLWFGKTKFLLFFFFFFAWFPEKTRLMSFLSQLCFWMPFLLFSPYLMEEKDQRNSQLLLNLGKTVSEY